MRSGDVFQCYNRNTDTEGGTNLECEGVRERFCSTKQYQRVTGCWNILSYMQQRCIYNRKYCPFVHNRLDLTKPPSSGPKPISRDMSEKNEISHSIYFVSGCQRGSGTRGGGRAVVGGWKKEGRRGRSGNRGITLGQGLGQEQGLWTADCHSL